MNALWPVKQKQVGQGKDKNNNTHEDRISEDS
jgi:hypothetical protein